MDKKQRRTFYFLFFSHIYCLVSGGFNGGDKMNFPGSYFWHFLAGWCTWNSIITLAFVLGKLSRPKTNTYFAKIFSLITMLSNLIAMIIYGSGLIIGLVTVLTTWWGITSQTIKLIPIPSHEIGKIQVGKVIQWGLYSPLGHFIAPAYFIRGFFRHERMNLLKKKLKMTILLCLILPTLYFSYGYFRSRLGDRSYFKEFKARGVLPFLSSKKMSNRLGIGRDYRFVGKIVLVVFGFSLFATITYFSLRMSEKIRKYLGQTNFQKKKKKTKFLYLLRS